MLFSLISVNAFHSAKILVSPCQQLCIKICSILFSCVVTLFLRCIRILYALCINNSKSSFIGSG